MTDWWSVVAMPGQDRPRHVERPEEESPVRRMSSGVVAFAAIAVIAAACGGGGGSSKAATAKSAADVGGMEELVKAAEAEAALNVVAVPPEWANYKGVLEKFKAKYPKIKVDEQGLDFNSQQEIDAVNNQKGTDKAPDLLDL
jgi:putative spermidine/putrescine transport system substrate-binding protein